MSNKNNRNKGLGRGLSALMADVPLQEPSETTPPARPDLTVPIETVEPNPDQPRRSFPEEALAELTASIREKGIIQPIIVRRMDGGQYQIVAGERRWRAAQQAQLHEAPAVIRNLSDRDVLEIAIIENIQRADLNPIDEASGYQLLLGKFGHTQEQLATALGKSRSHIANQMRLLTLPSDVIALVEGGKLSAGHARTLVGKPDASDLAKQIVAQGLSVREAEKLSKKAESPKKQDRPPRKKDADTLQIEGELSAQLGMAVRIDHRPGQDGGRVTIDFKSFEQLDDLMRLLSGQ